MTKLSKIKLPGAEANFAVANSPLFLLRKLRSDASVRSIAESFDSNVISNEIARELSNKPKDFLDSVRAYAYLVALSMRTDASQYLDNVLRLPSPYHHWFQFLCNVLLTTHIPTTVKSINATPSFLGHQEASTSNTSTTKQMVSMVQGK